MIKKISLTVLAVLALFFSTATAFACPFCGAMLAARGEASRYSQFYDSANGTSVTVPSTNASIGVRLNEPQTCTWSYSHADGAALAQSPTTGHYFAREWFHEVRVFSATFAMKPATVTTVVFNCTKPGGDTEKTYSLTIDRP